MDRKTGTLNVSESLNLYPDVTFENQHKDEKVISLVRAHLFTQMSWVFSTFFFLILIFALDIFFSSFFSFKYILVINIFAVIFVFSYALFNLIHWFYNVGIITNERIIDVDYSNVLYKEINTAGLKKIEDITTKRIGFFGSIFNYGDLFIQTAGNEINIEFYNIPNPSKIARIINELLKK